MDKKIFFYLTGIILFQLFFFCHTTFAQEKTEWKEDYTISSVDFQGKPPINSQFGVQRFFLNSLLEFSYNMNGYAFMFTKNFNKYVDVYFVSSSSWIEEGELKGILIQKAQLHFDLLELYARKFRKKMFESKQAFSDPNFYQKSYTEIQGEYAKQIAEIDGIVDDSEIRLMEQREIIRKEIKHLSSFCKTCKPKK